MCHQHGWQPALQVSQVEDGQIQKMEVLGNKGAGPRALYEALGGKMPATV